MGVSVGVRPGLGKDAAAGASLKRVPHALLNIFRAIASLRGRNNAVNWLQFKLWLKTTLPALGGPGLLLSAFIDSSFVPLPLVTDLALMALSSRHPMRMPYYAGMASLGSLAGCISIYHLARKGGLAY